jgi:hypothetical protein
MGTSVGRRRSTSGSFGRTSTPSREGRALTGARRRSSRRPLPSVATRDGGAHVAQESPVSVMSVAAPRSARRRADSPPSVLMTATGPPHLPLVLRGPLLRQIRQLLDAAGMRRDLALTGGWRRRAAAEGSAVLGILLDDEEQADTRGAWWLHDVRWSDAAGEACLLYEAAGVLFDRDPVHHLRGAAPPRSPRAQEAAPLHRRAPTPPGVVDTSWAGGQGRAT